MDTCDDCSTVDTGSYAFGRWVCDACREALQSRAMLALYEESPRIEAQRVWSAIR